MKILFLDIDGVLNSNDYAERFFKYQLIKKGNSGLVDPEAVERVRQLCEELNVKIILSSSWRGLSFKSTCDELMEYRDFRPIVPFMIGITPRTFSIRGHEIKTLMDNWKKNVEFGLIDPAYENESIEKYAIVDDYDDMYDWQKPYLVMACPWKGITDEDITKLKKVLS